MNRHLPRPIVRCSEWVLQRNPIYLVSAVIMAVGARLLLVGPDDVAGDLGLIVATLSVLQVYEWAVSAVLVVLARSGRSPEDRPWLLLVAAAFWMGPLAATVEMTIARPGVGLALATGAGLIAMGELRVICRCLHLRVSARTYAVGLACQSLVVLTPYALRCTTSDDGLSELVLFGVWWAVGAIVLLPFAVIIVRSAPPPDLHRIRHELGFAAMALAATILHLVGMNHAFYCHAKLFYAVPVLVAVSMVGMRFARQTSCPQPHTLIACASLPALGIILSIGPFSSLVPIHLVPPWLRDPMLTSLMLALAAWAYGLFLHRETWLLHTAVAGLGLCIYRVGLLTGSVGTELPVATTRVVMSPQLLAAATYAATGYLLLVAWWQRSRITGLVAVAVHLVGLSVLVWDRIACDTFFVGTVMGWSTLAAIHLMQVRSPLATRLVPILWLAVLTWSYDATPSVMWVARSHAACALILLFAIGYYSRWTHYRAVAVVCGSVYLAGHAGRFVLNTPRGLPLIVVITAFALLAAGGVVSWHKPRLLNKVKSGDG